MVKPLLHAGSVWGEWGTKIRNFSGFSSLVETMA